MRVARLSAQRTGRIYQTKEVLLVLITITALVVVLTAIGRPEVYVNEK